MQSLTGSFFLISLKRAFRLEIKPNEVLVAERKALAASAAHVTDPEHQAFLAWRRSVLLVVAIFFVPLTFMRIVESFDGPDVPATARAVLLFPAFAEGLFCLTAFVMLGQWTNWAKQRRYLFIAWVIYFIAPFVVYLYPFQEAYDKSSEMKQVLAQFNLGAKKKYLHQGVGVVMGIKAMLVLGPKAISLMPGMIRASIVSKLLFPGTSGPGFLLILAAPMYALFAYVIILMPYQITASVYFLIGLFGVMTAQIFIALSGRLLTMPLLRDEARHRIHRYWLAYIGILVVSAGVMLTGVYDLVTRINYTPLSIITTILSFASNVLVMTLIGTDAIIANMHRLAERRKLDEQHQHLREESEAKLRQFYG
ncbi:MAG TPA: hypothetical protein VM261_06705 [Kofleriaceae bacterium]|nr:hypothetical protein [Kofleriaceae bacterium]